jgi:chromate transporter
LRYALTAFGGPQSHIGMMLKTFAQERKDVTEEELLEYNSFCQMLPGPSSTQTIALVALKRGGIGLAIITLLIWIFPAVFLMGLVSFFVYKFQLQNTQSNLFTFIQPMTVGFIVYAAAKFTKKSVHHMATWAIMLGSIAVMLLFKSPWTFPLLLIAAGTVSNFSDRRIPEKTKKPMPIPWVNLWIFAIVFLVAGLLSEISRLQNWKHQDVFHIFENFYRFGSFVFGGGQVLLPLMILQFVNLPLLRNESPLISASAITTGYGIVQAVPGPVFSVCAYIGGMIMSGYGWEWQLIGILVATIAIFLPSSLILFFLFPVYQQLKQHVIIFRALEGILAAIVGVIWASGLLVVKDMELHWLNLAVIIATFILLYSNKIPAPIIVIACLLGGYLY